MKNQRHQNDGKLYYAERKAMLTQREMDVLEIIWKAGGCGNGVGYLCQYV